MKYLLFIFLLVAILITAGCVGGNQNSAVTTTTPVSVDPIVGVWSNVIVNDEGSTIFTFQFFSDGRVILAVNSTGSEGTWTKIRANEYSVTGGQSVVYNPQSDTISIAKYPDFPMHRQAKEPAITVSADPIVGNWQWTVSDGSKKYTFNFFLDGRYSFTDSSDPNNQPGTWSKVRENEYLITYIGGKTQALVYNPVTDTFTMPEFSSVLAYRLGKEPVRTPTPTPTAVRTQDPIIGVWRYSSSSGFDNRFRFNADGTYVQSFYYVKTQETVVTNGKWIALTPSPREGLYPYVLEPKIGNFTGSWESYFYLPEQNAIINGKFKTLLLTPYNGDIAVEWTRAP